MIKKKENCEYCGEKMESKTAKKRFCSEKCRVYFNRESKYFKEKNLIEIIDTTGNPNILANSDLMASNLANKPKKVEIPIENKKTPKNGLKMPLGLSASEKIEWKIENLWK